MENYYFALANAVIISAAYYWCSRCKTPRNRRRFAVRPVYEKRGELGEFGTFFQEIKLGDPHLFFSYTRMSVQNFNRLLGLLRRQLQKNCRTTRVIGPEERLAFTLKYLTTGDSMQSTGWGYRIAKSTASTLIKETCLAIWEVLQPLYVQPPTKNQWEKIAEEFWKTWNFPNCLGSMDGKQVVIQAPQNSGSLYFNYKHVHSMNLFAVADANYIFRYVDIGYYGAASDGGVLLNSCLGIALHQGVLNIPETKVLPNTDKHFPYFFVGDEAFPLKPNIMRPYPGKNLSQSRRIFNYRLSRARRVVENAFGILTSRWRVFRKPIIAQPDTVEAIIKACVCLHNFLKSSQDGGLYCPPQYIDRENSQGFVMNGEWRDEVSGNCAMRRLGRIGTNNHTVCAARLREELAAYLMEEGAVEWQEQVVNYGNETGYIG